MPICPQGHDSPTADYCDYCGWPMSAPGQQSQQHSQQQSQPAQHQQQHPQQHGQPYQPYAAEPQQQHGPPTPYQQHPPSTTGLVVCPICSTPQTERYCEECGYDYDLASPSRRVQQPPAAFPGYQQQPQAPQHQAPPQQQQPQQGQPQQPGPPSRPGPGPDFGMSSPYQQQPPQQQHPPQAYQQPQHQPQQPPQHQQPQQPQQPQHQQPPQYGGQQPASYGGVTYSTGDTSGGFGTDFMLEPPAGEQQYQTPTPSGRGTWVATVNADRDYFDDMMARSGPDAAGLYFPPYSPERRVPMTGRGQLRIGRRSHQRGTVPEIDLSIAPEDPGASHQHALLQEQPDGGWVVIDQDSTNGTSINGGADPIAAHQPIPLQDGDRIHVGAWTTITVHRA